MTKQLQRASEAHKDYQKLLEVLKLGRLAGALLGQQLYLLKANNAFREAVGDGVDTWEDFLKMPEIKLDVRESNRAMEIYEEFCIKRGYSTEMLAEAGTKTLHYLLPMVKKNELDKGELDGLLKDGAELPQKSFRERLHDVKHPGGTKTYRFELFRRCVETNTLQKVHDIDSDIILNRFPELRDMIMPEVI